MRRLILVSLLLLLQLYLHAQYDGSYAGGRAAALGDVAVSFQDGWSTLNNPAGLGGIDKMSAGVFYESRFSMSEFSTRGAVFQIPTELGNFGLGFSYYGFNIYNEKRFVLAYGRQLTPKLRAGLSFDYLHTQLDDETSKLTAGKGVITFQAGLQADLSDKFKLGFSVFNPYSAKLSEYENENIPAIARLGVAYLPDDRFLLILEAEQNMKHDLRIKSGLEYKINERFIARGGIKTNPAEYSFGFGMEFKGIVFDVSAAYHLVLGYSPHGSFMYEFGE